MQNMIKIWALAILFLAIGSVAIAEPGNRKTIHYEVECKHGGCCCWLEITYVNGVAWMWQEQDCWGEITNGFYAIVVGSGPGSGTPIATDVCGSNVWSSWIATTDNDGVPLQLTGQDCDGAIYIANR